MNTTGHYRVIRQTGYAEILRLVCDHCGWMVPVSTYPGARSGLPRYNRARGNMVRHLHAIHADKLRATEGKGTP